MKEKEAARRGATPRKAARRNNQPSTNTTA